MSTLAQTAPVITPAPQWRYATRIAFRFCFIYFGLFCLSTAIFSALFPIPKVNVPALSDLGPTRQIVLWTGIHIFRINPPPSYNETGSGDRVVDWVLVFCLLVTAALATALWSALDRRSGNHAALYKWFRLVIRFSLAGQMMFYGMIKAVPIQMPFPRLTQLLQPYGNFSPAGVLWASIGASPGYEIFAGCAELLGGILLLIPRTTMFGALICLADLTQVFVLNMTYDVPVKLYSFHLILLGLFLLAPGLKRLAGFFFLAQEAKLSGEPPLFRTARANRMALAAQIVFGVLLLAGYTHVVWGDWHTRGGGRPKPEFYGIWDIEQMSADGQLKPPLLTDGSRWRRAIFDFTDGMTFESLDGTLANFGAAINLKSRTLTLTKRADKNWKADFSFERPSKDHLALDGAMDSHRINMQLRLADTGKYLLLSRGFHWIQEYPFIR